MAKKKTRIGRPPKGSEKLRNLIHVALDDEQYRALGEFQHDIALPTESAAIRMLLVWALREKGHLQRPKE